MDVVRTEDLIKQEFEGLDLAGPYGRLLGRIEAEASVLYWGPPGGGKSTLATGMARALADHGVVIYCTPEEGPGGTVAERVRRLGAAHPNLMVAEFTTLKELKAAIEKAKARFLFVDSASELGGSTPAVLDFLQWCRARGIGLHFIAHAYKDGSTYKGDARFAHRAYVVVRVESGHARCQKNRYAGTAEIDGIGVPFTSKESGFAARKSKSKPTHRKASTVRKKRQTKVKRQADVKTAVREMKRIENLLK